MQRPRGRDEDRDERRRAVGEDDRAVGQQERRARRAGQSQGDVAPPEKEGRPVTVTGRRRQWRQEGGRGELQSRDQPHRPRSPCSKAYTRMAM